jgi:hypothetical protein
MRAAAALLLTALHCAFAASAPAAILRGKIVNRSSGEPGKAESVRLLDMTNQLDQIGTVLDASGSYEFQDVPSRTAPYLLQTQSGGVLYSQPVRVEGDETVADIEVYDSSPSLDGISFSMHHLIVERHDDVLNMMEFLEVENASNPPVAVWRDNGPLTIELPSAAQEPFEVSVSTPSGTPLHQELLETERAHVYTIPYALKPGTTRVVIRYQLPYAEAAADFSAQVHLPVTRRSLLVSPADVEVRGAGLTLSEEASPIPGYGVYIGTPLAAGESIAFQLRGGSEHAATQEEDPHAGLDMGSQGADADVQEVVRRPHRLSAARSRWLLMGGLGAVLLLGLLNAGKRRDAEGGDALSEWEDRYVSGGIDRLEFEKRTESLRRSSG